MTNNIGIKKADFENLFLNGGLNKVLEKGGKLVTTNLKTYHKFNPFAYGKVDQNQVAEQISKYVQANITTYNPEQQTTIRTNLKALRDKFTKVESDPIRKTQARNLLKGDNKKSKHGISYDFFRTAIRLIPKASSVVGHSLQAASIPAPAPRTRSAAKKPEGKTLAAPASQQLRAATPVKPTQQLTVRPNNLKGRTFNVQDALVEAISTTITTGTSKKASRLPENDPVMQQIKLHEEGYRLENGTLVLHPELAISENDRTRFLPSGTFVMTSDEPHVQYLVKEPSSLGYRVKVIARKQDQIFTTQGVKVDIGALIRRAYAEREARKAKA